METFYKIRIVFIFSSIVTALSSANGQTGNLSYKNVPSNLISDVVNSSSFSTAGNGFIHLEGYTSVTSNGKRNNDFTSEIQRILNLYRKVILPNYPIYINANGLDIPSNTTLVFQPLSKLVILPNNKSTYELIRIHNVSGVKILNAKLEGDRAKHIGNSGEWGHGISIRGARNVEVRNFEIENFWGDGIYIGGANLKYSDNVVINNGKLDYCRRNGISITSGNSISISNVAISNTMGVAPMFGIDVEPNSNKDVINDIFIKNVITYNNSGGGVALGLNKLNLGGTEKICNLSINNMKDIGSKYGILFGNINAKNNLISGSLKINNVQLEDNHQPFILKSNSSNSFKISVNSINILKPKNANFNNNELKRILKLRKDVSLLQ